MVELVYGIWDFNRMIENPFVSEHVTDLGNIVEADCITRPYFRGDMCYRLLRRTVATPATHLVVIRSGTTISNFEELDKAVTEFCEQNDFAVAGHLMQHDHESYPWLHNQFFIMNMDFFRRAGAPYPTFPEAMQTIMKFDSGEKPGSYLLPPFVRSAENIHDTHTPLWVKAGEGDYMEIVPDPKFGQVYIACALRLGRSIVNLPDSIRRLKGFVYPEMASDKFEQAIKDVRAGVIPDTADLYPPQKWYISQVLPPRPKTVFIRNTEELASPPSDERFETIAAPAAGFKPMALWNDLGKADSRIAIYDFNQESLDFWKNVISNWGGHNLLDFFATAGIDITDERYDAGLWETLESDIHSHFGGEAAFLDAWERFKGLEHQFVLCDLLDDQKPLLDALEGSTLLSISNIFLYRTTMRLLGAKVMRESFDRLISGLKPDTMVLGFAPTIKKLWDRAGVIGSGDADPA